MLPGKNGFEIITSLRSLGIITPLFVVSARNNPEDRITALNLGADDYLVKDFSLGEMLARIKSLIRRSSGAARNLFRCGDLVVSLAEMKVTRNGNTIKLAKKDFALLMALLRKKSQIIPPQKLIRDVWGQESLGKSNTLNVHMRTLRKAIDNGHDRKLIHTRRGYGYSISEKI